MSNQDGCTDLYQAVNDGVDQLRAEAVEILSGLIGIASINPNYPGCVYEELVGGESAANEFLSRYYSEAGLSVSWIERAPGRANLVGVLPGTHRVDAKALALNGHIDVVPPGELSDWTTDDPFKATVDDGKIYGRGACDMKGGLVSTLLAATALHRAGIRLRGDLILHSVVGEETGDHDLGVRAVIEEGFGGDAAIVAESTDHHVGIVSGGLLWMTLRIKGKAGHNNLRGELVHAGGRGEAAGVNALEKGVYLLTMLQELERQWGQSKSHPLFKPGWFSLHPGVFVGAPEGIMVPFMISTSCTIDYSVLYPPNETVEDIKSEIEEFVLRASQLDPWLKKHPPRIEYQLHWPPFTIDPDHPIVDATVGAYRQAANISVKEDPGRATGYGAVCDASYFAEAGIPAVVYGGGPPQRGHTADEYTEIDRVLLAAKSYALTAIEWCGLDATT